jgi:citrate synthase
MNPPEIAAARSSISVVTNGEVRYAGYLLSDLVEHSHFEEVTFLLWNRRLPRRTELEAFREALHSHRSLPNAAAELLSMLPKSSPFLDKLRTGLSVLGCFDPFGFETSAEGDRKKAIRMFAEMPHLISVIAQHGNGEKTLAPKGLASTAAELLYLLKGTEASAAEIHALDQALMVYADNEFNISTFCARMAASTHADLYACVTSALGAFEGPLHGGANQHVMEMLMRIEDKANVPEFLTEALERKEKIWGLGHLIYKDGDPRAPEMKKIAEGLSRTKNDFKYFEISCAIEDWMKAKKGIKPNVDFYAASVFYLLGLSPEIFPAVFAMGRLSGWIAHSLEQMGNWKILMPRAEYTGVKSATYSSIAERK